ncbi:LytTR family DNA-binding domain-containing protein [Thiofaba sp. EF100]|jgi:two-component system response regulator AlgR|uniref:LytR/AlgR family response regulator transcription factor n=1 Tax=Thiofaba sp. EF100 TaxID=3121274 RepID=UPI0032219255
MKVVIADDERLARERLARQVAALGHEVVGEAAEGAALWPLLERTQPEVVLLDIAMPGEDGLSLGARLSRLPLPPALIFVTAYPEHALHAFAAHPVDYLLKPVSLARLQAALEAAGRSNRAQQARSEVPMHLAVRVGRELKVVPIESVRCFLAEEKYVTVCTTEGEYVLDQSLRQLEEQQGERFLRVHRAALVAKAAIQGLEQDGEGRHWVHLAGGRRIEVSRRQLSRVREWLDGGRP